MWAAISAEGLPSWLCRSEMVRERDDGSARVAMLAWGGVDLATSWTVELELLCKECSDEQRS